MIVCLDANCVIYLVEADPNWGPKITAKVAALRAAGHETAIEHGCGSFLTNDRQLALCTDILVEILS